MKMEEMEEYIMSMVMNAFSHLSTFDIVVMLILVGVFGLAAYEHQHN